MPSTPSSFSTSWFAPFLDQAVGDGNSTPSLLLSAALFIGGNLLFHYSNPNNRGHDGDYSGDGENAEESLEWAVYLRSRLKHRLSFPCFSEMQQSTNDNNNSAHQRTSFHSSQRNGEKQHIQPVSSFEEEECLDDENDDRPAGSRPRYSVDFYPKNSNWCHFESPEESRKSSMVVKRNSQSTKSARQLANQASSIAFSKVEREGSAIFSSLEGDRAVPNDMLVQQDNPTSLHQRALSDDDEDETTDGDDSQSSKEHFVWTDAEYRESFRFKRKSAARARKHSAAIHRPLPVILSERNATLPTHSSENSPVFLSQASSLQGSVTDVEDDYGGVMDDGGDESDSRCNQLSTASSLHFAPNGGDSKSRAETTSPSSEGLPDIVPAPLSPRSEGGKLPDAPNQKKMPKRTFSAPLMRSVAPLTRVFRRSASNKSEPSNNTPPNASLSEHRANYNARIMPHRLILVRHGQSMGNIDETLYSQLPDNAIPLTKMGFLQAREAGQRLRQIIKGSSDVHFVVSPYVRTVETWHGIASAWSDPEKEFGHLTDPLERRNAWYERLISLGLTWAEDPRIREQDFGNLQDPAKIKQSKKERNTFGAFYYRFSHGESASDVFDRISTFLDSLWRSFDVHPSRHFVVVTHGIAIRVLLARYFRYTIDQFHMLSNPRNCEMIVLQHDGHGRLRLAGRHELDVIQTAPPPNMPPANGESIQMRYKFKKRLRVLPPEFVRYSKTRIHYEEDKGNDNE